MRSPLETAVIPLGRLLRNRRAGDDASIRHAPELAAAGSLTVTSASFPAGGAIPIRYSKVNGGSNVSPELSWSPVPVGTAQLLIVMEDVDVPSKKPSIHMSGLFAPTVTVFAEGVLTASNPDVRFIPRLGQVGYYGPRPLPGHGPHAYTFHIFALSNEIPRSTTISALSDVLALVSGRVLAAGSVTGYQEG